MLRPAERWSFSGGDRGAARYHPYGHEPAAQRHVRPAARHQVAVLACWRHNPDAGWPHPGILRPQHTRRSKRVDGGRHRRGIPPLALRYRECDERARDGGADEAGADVPDHLRLRLSLFSVESDRDDPADGAALRRPARNRERERGAAGATSGERISLIVIALHIRVLGSIM